METNYWLGDLKEAGAFGDLYRKRLESDYEECDDLGLSIEELMTRPNMESRQTLYNLFCWAYYTGRGDQARRYIGLMSAGYVLVVRRDGARVLGGQGTSRYAGRLCGGGPCRLPDGQPGDLAGD